MWTLVMASGAMAAPTTEVVWVDQTAAPASTLRALGLSSRETMRGDWMQFDAPSSALSALTNAGVPWELAAEPAAFTEPGYTGATEMVDELTDLAERFGALAERVDLGTSVNGRPLVALRLTATSTPAVSWRILGAHHGDELTSAELALDAATALLEGYGTDGQLTSILDRDEVWVFPHVNPDGVEAVTRRNANNVDLNRNYSFEWSSSESGSGPAPFSEPETRAVRALSALAPFGAGLSMHAGATNLGWVWNYTYSAPPDEPLVADMAGIYDDACTQSGFYITNGADWYPTRGDTNDWSYGVHGTLDFTLEVSGSKHPDFSAVSGILNHHRDAVFDFLAAPEVVYGQVVDRDTGLPVPSLVTLGAGQPLVSGMDGRWGRPVDPAVDNGVHIHAPGFGPAEQISPGLWAVAPDTVGGLAVDPALLSSGTEGCVAVQGATGGAVTLSRPGRGELVLSWDDDCEGILLDTDGMEPGAWTVSAGGWVAPRALHVGEVDNRVEAEEASLDDTLLTLVGHDFGVGTRAWAFVTDARLPVALPVTSESADALTVDIGPAAAYDLKAVQIVTNGAMLTVVDPAGSATVDTDAPDPADRPDEDAGTDAPAERPTSSTSDRVHAGCSTGPAPLPSLLLLSPALLAVARRRR